MREMRVTRMEGYPMTVTAWPTGERNKVIARIKAHKAADQIVQGTGFRDGRGCAIGCSLDCYDHGEYCRVVLGESVYNLLLASLIDDIHESLPPNKSTDWPLRVAEALADGADTSQALQRWLLWQMGDLAEASLICRRMVDLMERGLSGEEVAQAMDEAATAAGDAWAAGNAWDAWVAWTVWDAWVACGPWGASDDRGARVARAARDACATRDAWVTRDAYAITQADALIAVLRGLPLGVRE